jgi:hypothetical protein
MDNGTYGEIQEHDKNSALQELKSNDERRIVNALLGLALNEQDWKWVQDICIKFSSHSSHSVRGIAILCFGHLARIHRELEIEKVLPIVKKALYDSNDFVKGHANNALDDIQFFLE